MGRLLAVVSILVVLGGVAGAQPGGEPGAPPPPPPAGRSPFDQAFDAMLRGDFAAASAGFHTIAAGAADPGLRASATDMARLADELVGRGARLSYGAGPGTPVGPVPVSEDDSPSGGRASFIETTTLASLYSGIVLIDLLNVNDVRAGTLLVMGSTAAGVLGSVYGTSGHRMTGAMADAWGLGLGTGVLNALLLSGPLGFYRATNHASEKVQSLTLASAWGGAAAGLLIADSIHPTRGQVNVVGTFGAMGVASTLLSLAMIQPSNLGGDTFLTITAAGYDAGLGAGAAFAGKLDWSSSRARLVGLSAFLGAVAGGGTSILLFANNGNSNSGRLAAGITLGGLWGGFALGMRLTRDMAPDYRFRKQGGSNAMLSPTVIHGAPAMSLAGSF